jgi:hypothetical protein
MREAKLPDEGCHANFTVSNLTVTIIKNNPYSLQQIVKTHVILFTFMYTEIAFQS